jgi:hypothetical protein
MSIMEQTSDARAVRQAMAAKGQKPRDKAAEG